VADKTVCSVDAVEAVSGAAIKGYEIHIGVSDGPDCARPFAYIDGVADGASSPDGRIIGSYLHGMFVDDGFRAAFLQRLGAAASGHSYTATVETVLDELASHMEAHLDVDELIKIARPRR